MSSIKRFHVLIATDGSTSARAAMTTAVRLPWPGQPGILGGGKAGAGRLSPIDSVDGTGSTFGAPHQLNEIAVSDRETLGGFTQFLWALSSRALKPLNANQIEERCRSAPACAIISARPLASC
jgi:hypothetical protein